MIYHRNTAVRIVAVDRCRGEATIQEPSGKVRCVPWLTLRCTGGDRELRGAILRCEANQTRLEKGEQ